MSQLDIERRLVELESRLAFQEHTLAELNQALVTARQEIACQAELLRRALDDLKSAHHAVFADSSSEPPPPHY